MKYVREKEYLLGKCQRIVKEIHLPELSETLYQSLFGRVSNLSEIPGVQLLGRTIATAPQHLVCQAVTDELKVDRYCDSPLMYSNELPCTF